MTLITANKLQSDGISAVQSALQCDYEAIITVRGQPKYVILAFDTYQEMNVKRPQPEKKSLLHVAENFNVRKDSSQDFEFIDIDFQADRKRQYPQPFEFD